MNRKMDATLKSVDESSQQVTVGSGEPCTVCTGISRRRYRTGWSC